MATPRIRFNRRDLERWRRAVRKVDPRDPRTARVIDRVIKQAAFEVQSIATRKYMRGPKPRYIEVRTGRLIRSVAVRRQAKMAYAVGTPVVYGPVHEFGAPSRNIPKRPWLQPAFDEVTKKLPDRLLREWERASVAPR